ncbi:MAG: alpha/beta hydrolase [Saprospiraceae bacterium]|nr:alpha/beta hydrolase [Saprospiraceae bacterium]
MLTFLYILAGLYVLLCLLFYFGQHYFFFRPEILPGYFKYEYTFPFTEHTFEMPDGGRINAIHFTVPNTRGVVYYLKGNSRSIKGWGKFARDFLGKGYDFFMMDYRGFGKSRGKRSERRLYADALHVFDWLTERYSPDDIVIYGRSFGSGIAACVASQRQARLLILDAPYYSFHWQIRRFAGWLPLRWLLKYKIPTHQFVRSASCPVRIIHGDRDYIISYRQGVMLRDAAPDKVELVTIRGGRHNNLTDFSQYHRELYRILEEAAA